MSEIWKPKCVLAIFYYPYFGCPNFGNPNVFSQFSITHILGVRFSETQIFSTKISIFCDTLAVIYCQDFGCPNFGNPNVFLHFSITYILGVRISETQMCFCNFLLPIFWVSEFRKPKFRTKSLSHAFLLLPFST